MFPEISLNILDVVQNSIGARASLVEITVSIDTTADTLTVIIRDDGRGMSEAELSRAVDPFYTTRTTRKYGFGVPFFQSRIGNDRRQLRDKFKRRRRYLYKGCFVLSHIDRMPLGDMTGTLISLINANCRIDFSYNYSVDEKRFSLDTRQLRAILGSVPLNIPEVTGYITRYLEENTAEVNGGIKY